LLSFVAGELSAVSAQDGHQVLKEGPEDGEIPYGRVVLVDNGTCLKEKVKAVTGGRAKRRYHE
jgi:hypothetical protein